MSWKGTEEMRFNMYQAQLKQIVAYVCVVGLWTFMTFDVMLGLYMVGASIFSYGLILSLLNAKLLKRHET